MVALKTKCMLKKLQKAHEDCISIHYYRVSLLIISTHTQSLFPFCFCILFCFNSLYLYRFLKMVKNKVCA